MAAATARTRHAIMDSPFFTAEQRRVARVASRLNQRTYCRLRWSWAWSSLTQGRLGCAAVEAGRALRDTVNLSLART